MESHRQVAFIANRLQLTAAGREARRITFHSSRRFANTLWRLGGVPDPVVRRWTGHATEAMTERYTDYLAGDLELIASAQARLAGG